MSAKNKAIGRHDRARPGIGKGGANTRRQRRLRRSVCLLVMLALVWAGVVGPTLAANEVLWTEVAAPSATGAYYCAAFGDVNSDGQLDVVAGSVAAGVQVWTGDGAGGWTSRVGPNVGAYPGLALGDINLDGKLDVIGASDGGGVDIWTGDGTGTGWTVFPSPLAAGRVAAVAVGDINNDGHPDLAAGSNENLGIGVATGNAAGGWFPAGTNLPINGNYSRLAFGDFNNDGLADLFAASRGRGVQVWRGNGEGTWTEVTPTHLPTSGDFYGLALGDVNNDGKLDVVAGGDDLGLRAWTGNGSGSWTRATTGLPDSGDFWGVAIGDINNDGHPDIAAGHPPQPGSTEGGLAAWIGNGAGGWAAASDGLPVTGLYTGIDLGDLNDDGMLDLLAANAGNLGVRAWIETGEPDALGGWVAITSPATTGSYLGVAAGDIDHDGDLDVLAGGAGGGFKLWAGDGGNTWTDYSARTDPDLPTTGAWPDVALRDVSRDGALDVVASSNGSGVKVWRMVNVGWHPFSTGLPAAGAYTGIEVGDFNRDGHMDIVAGSEATGVRAWRGNSAGLWTSASVGLPDTGGYWAVALGDVNHDGQPDIVAGGDGSGIKVWQGSGGGPWTARPTGVNTGTFRDVVLADIDDDGDLDIVAASAGGIGLWAGNGAFGWTALPAPAGKISYRSVTVRDFNNDGKLDLAAGSSAGLRAWTGNGGAAWADYDANLPVAGEFAGVAAGEIDNDGVADLIAAVNGAGGGVYAWTGAEGAAPSGWTEFAPTGWTTSPGPIGPSIAVRDTGSGLKIGSAQYKYWGVSGESGWLPATCTGADGATDPQTITASNVHFGQDSGPAPYAGNRIQFRIRDTAGNLGTSDVYNVLIDTTPPDNPTSFTDSRPWPGAWSANPRVWVDWDPASDATSGVAGYSYVFATAYQLPDTTRDTYGTEAESDPLADGNWYIYVRTRDAAGNWAPDAALDGPFGVDTARPTNPTSFTSVPSVSTWTNDNTIQVNWSGATDGGSSVWGYSLIWTQTATGSPAETFPPQTEPSTTSAPLADSSLWYLHVKAVDHARNWASGAAHYGPFYVDTTAPHACSVTAPATSSSPSFAVSWGCEDHASGMDNYEVQVRDGAAGSWAAWQATAANSATFSGGVNNHTYYFRVRGRDHANNLSGWGTEAHTQVLLPPSAASFTPATGFASAGQDSPPLQRVHGTRVTISGSNLTGGVATFNGVAMDPDLSTANDTTISAVIGRGTPLGPGRIVIRTPNGETRTATDFTVIAQPFPVRWGLGFDNFGTPSLPWSTYEQAFGRCAVNFCRVPWPASMFMRCEWGTCPDELLGRRPDAEYVFDDTDDIADGGNCYGISSLTMNFYHGREHPSDFAAGADIPGSLLFSTPDLVERINALQWRQISLEAAAAKTTNEALLHTAGPGVWLDVVEAELDADRPPMVTMNNPGRGHGVNAYDVDVAGGQIQIYDNNWSYVVDGDAAMTRAISVDADARTWSYGSYNDLLGVVTDAIVAGPNTVPSFNPLAYFFFGDAGGAAHFSAENAAGQTIGYDAAGHFSRTIPPGEATLVGDFTDPQPFEGFRLERTGNYTFRINGAAGGNYDMTLLAGGGNSLALRGVHTGATTQDAVRLLVDGAQPSAAPAFEIGTNDAAKAIEAHVVYDEAVFTLKNLSVAGQHPLTLARAGAAAGMTAAAGGVGLSISGGAGGAYDVCIERAAEGSLPAELCWSGMQRAAGDRQVLTPTDWDQLNTSDLRVDLDVGNDGTVDSTQILVGHGLALTAQGTPLIIHSGDLIHYTLAYTVTGETLAPGLVLSTTVPANTTFVGASGGVTPVAGQLTWQLGDKTAPASGQELLTVQVGQVSQDAIIPLVAHLSDGSGRWAMALAASVGPTTGGPKKQYLPLIARP